jgi:uncharacterized membrane protein
MSILQSMVDSMSDPRTRHAILVHFPVVMGTLATLPMLALAVTAFRNNPLRIAVIAMLLVASGGAGLAAGAGEEAEDMIDGARMTRAADVVLEEHESLGEGGWMWPLGAAALVALTFVKRKPVRFGAGGLGVLATIGVAGWVSLTAHTGGKLVYHHGVNTGFRPGDASATPATPGASNADGATRTEDKDGD